MTTILPLVAGASSLVATGAVLYRCIRPRFPVTVNCHFCDANTKVPYGNQNCWDCPNCDQYNGFALDGDYNKPIPAQFAEDLNHPISAEQRAPTYFNSGSMSVLCEQCTRNQLLKVKQLSNFVSYEESNYDAEVDAYQTHLEHVYRLCRACEKKVDRVLRKQDDTLHRKFIEKGSPARTEVSYQERSFTTPQYLTIPTPAYVRALRLAVLTCALVVLVADCYTLLQRLDIGWRTQDKLHALLFKVYRQAWYAVFTALLINSATIFLSGRESLSGADAASSILWLLMVMLHSSLPSLIAVGDEFYQAQCVLTLLTAGVGLWCLLCPRYKRSASPTRIRTRRLRPDSSFASSTSSRSREVSRNVSRELSRDLSREATPPPTSSSPASRGNVVPNVVPAADPLDYLETLSIGEPARLDFRDFLAPSPSQRVPSAPSMGNGINHLRQQRPLVSPARFRASVARTVTPPATLSGHRYVRHHSFGLPKNTPRSSTRALFQQQPSSQLNTSFLGNSSFTGNSQGVFDDRASLFSEPRQRHEDNDHSSVGSSDSSFSPSRASSTCPVDTTFTEPAQPKQKEAAPKRSLLTSMLWGVSIGLNICLVLYFFVDKSSWMDLASLLV